LLKKHNPGAKKPPSSSSFYLILQVENARKSDIEAGYLIERFKNFLSASEKSARSNLCIFTVLFSRLLHLQKYAINASTLSIKECTTPLLKSFSKFLLFLILCRKKRESITLIDSINHDPNIAINFQMRHAMED
jgi:hypothetical protein